MIRQNGRNTKREDEESESIIVDNSSDPIFGGAVDFLSKEAIYGDGEGIDDMPDEIREFFDAHDLSRVVFKVLLKVIPEGGTSADEAFVKSWRDKVPSIDYIANEWGPGQYILIFTWRCTDPETKRVRNFSERVSLSVSDKYQDQYDDYQEAKRIKRAEQRKQRLARLRDRQDIESAIYGREANKGEDDPLKAGEQYIEKMSKAAEVLGWKRSGFDWENIAKLLVPALPSIIAYLSDKQSRSLERQDRFLTLMMSTMQNNTTQLVEALKGHNGPSTGSEIMKEMLSMVTGAMDIQSTLKGETKEGIVDKIFRMVENVAPMVLSMSLVPRQQREALPAYQAARAYVENDPTFQQAQNDPEILKMLVDRWDDWYGWEQTDGIINVAGFERPSTCPRLPEKRFKNGDPRNRQDNEPPIEYEKDENWNNAGDNEGN